MIRGDGGFTLAEVLVATAFIAITAGAIGVGFMQGTGSVETGRQQTTAVYLAEQRLEQLKAWSLNSTGGQGWASLVTGAAFTAIAAGQTATSLVLQNDWNGNGIIEPGVTTNVNGMLRGEQVTYSYVGTQLMRQESGVDAAAVPLVGGIQSLTFTYLGADGATTAVTDNIRSVTVAVRGGPQTRAPTNPCAPYTYAEGNVGVAMIDTARIRNR